MAHFLRVGVVALALFGAGAVLPACGGSSSPPILVIHGNWASTGFGVVDIAFTDGAYTKYDETQPLFAGDSFTLHAWARTYHLEAYPGLGQYFWGWGGACAPAYDIPYCDLIRNGAWETHVWVEFDEVW